MREPSLEVAMGFMGVGKSWTTNEIADQYIKSNPAIGRRGRPVLILDVNGEYDDDSEYSGYKAIDYDATIENDYARASEIRKIIKPGKYRIGPYRKDRQPMSTNEIVMACLTICKYYRGGMLVLEDINKYMMHSLKQDFVGTLIGLRHSAVDLIVHFQTLRAIPPRIWGNMTSLRWHKISETIDKTPGKVGNPELFAIAQSIVNEKFKDNERYYLWLQPLKNKLINVTYEDFEKGCLDYLSSNPRIIRMLMNKEDIEGNRIHADRGEAIKTFISSHSQEYLPQITTP